MTTVAPYEPFDQDVRLPPAPWKPTDPELIAWETAHGHDVRLDCYPEYGCLVIEDALERRIARLEAELEARDEWRCPDCGSVTRARMSDAPGTGS